MPTNSEPKWTLERVKDATAAFQKSGISTQRRYQYAPLKEREIRLLKITFPATRDSILGLELEATSIDSGLPFQAISYCWGDINQSYHKAPILAHQRRESADGTSKDELSWIKVTKSLAEMLAYLPRHCIPPGDTSSYIWIDQLCINQNEEKSPYKDIQILENSSEKAGQIKLMGEIYSRATEVLIWLGPGRTPRAAERIPKIEVLSLLSREDTFAMQYVWKNPWFERTWVVQESSLAQKRQVLVGLQMVSLELLAMITNPDVDVDSSAITRHLSAVIMWQKFDQIADHCDASRGILLCSFLARFCQHLKLRDPRDRVLAFMSLWNPPSFDTASMSQRNQGQVYTELARSLVKDTKRLDLLAALRTGPLAGDTFPPSWVPKWDAISQPGPLMVACYSTTTLSPLSLPSTMLHSTRSRHETAPLQAPSTIQWKASSPHNEHKYVAVSQEDSTMTTRGKIICSIGGVLPPITHHPVSEQAIEKFRSSLHSNEHSITIQEAMRILIECSELGRPDKLAGRGPLSELQRLISRVVPGQIGPTVPQHAIDGIAAIHGPSFPLFDSTGRRFFTTTPPEGMQMLSGLGPGWTEVGDDIAILHGCRFPVILRKYDNKSQTYRVVGDCCIPEVMEGEAVNWAEEEADIISLV